MADYFLETKRLRFRTWDAGDLDLARTLWGDERVTKFIDARGRLSDEMVQERLDREIESGLVDGIQYWPIFLLEDDSFVGCCGLRSYDYNSRVMEIGAHIVYDYWGRKIASEALVAVIKYSFVELSIYGLFAGHNPENQASRALLKKLGFRYTHKEFYKPTGLMHPSYLMTVDDYRERLKK